MDEIKAVYEEDAPSYNVVNHWHCQFKCGHTSVETVSIPGHPLLAIDDATIQQSEASISEDHRNRASLVHEVKISLGLWKKTTYLTICIWISCPWLLTPLEKQERLKGAKALLAMYQDKQKDVLID